MTITAIAAHNKLRDATTAMLSNAYAALLGALSVAGVAVVAGLLLYEHLLVKADDLSRVDAAFFTMNGYVSVLFFLFWAADIFYARSF